MGNSNNVSPLPILSFNIVYYHVLGNSLNNEQDGSPEKILAVVNGPYDLQCNDSNKEIKVCTWIAPDKAIYSTWAGAVLVLK